MLALAYHLPTTLLSLLSRASGAVFLEFRGSPGETSVIFLQGAGKGLQQNNVKLWE